MTNIWRIGLLAVFLAALGACQSTRSVAPLPTTTSGTPTDPLILAPGAGSEDGEDDIETSKIDGEDGTDEEGTDSGADTGAPPPPPPPASASLTVGRADLAGGWTLESEGERCQLFMSLTSWSGGFRATTKGCNLPHLVGIASWNLNEKQVQLKSSSGEILAYLYPTAAEKFDGQTRRGGMAISFFR